MIESLLIANRGEIACRVVRTARRLGVHTIAVVSEADRGALHAELADEAHCIGPPPAAESYLVGERMIALARERGAQAIHPGYGFLSENAAFAEACAAAGIVFVGPGADAIRAMGLKDEAKARMRRAGVPVVPGIEGAADAAAYQRAAEEIGYPVLVKAVAGGGGKGMRRVEDAQALEKALDGARREAAAAFGDDRLLLEKWVDTPRHVEVQVFADTHGGCVHLFERDCSLQRRHQKVVEEAPAPGMSAELREAMCGAAVRAAEAIGYVGAGTIEFVVDAGAALAASGGSGALGPKTPHYFIEMNTRLQVEHPVTEAITGVDLVEWQLRIASGEPLPLSQAEIDERGPRGHAVEVRLYSEDPSKGYIPSTGTLGVLRFPEPPEGLPYHDSGAEGGVRVDTGVRQGDTVTPFYDPMIAKLVAHGGTRAAAIARMGAGLRELRIAGVATNAQLLANVLSHSAFRDLGEGELDTGFLERNAKAVVPPKGPTPPELLAIAAFASGLLDAQATAEVPARSPWAVGDAFRLFGGARERLVLEEGKKRHTLVLARNRDGGDGAIEVSLEDGDPEAAPIAIEGVLEPAGHGGALRLRGRADGRPFDARVARLGRELWIAVEGRGVRLRIFDPAAEASAADTSSAALRAPMPGRVVELLVEPQARVRRGAVLARMDAMKMEHALRAPRDGVVERVAVAVGAQVEEGDVIVALVEA